MASRISMKALYLLVLILHSVMHFQVLSFHGIRRGKCPLKCQCSSSSLMMVYCQQEPGKRALTQFPANIPVQVEFLSLANNNITNIGRNDFSNLTRLSTLKLRGNHISGLPAGVFRDLRAIRSLNLGNNRLSSLRSNVFQGLSTLRELFLDGNELRQFPEGVFKNLPSMKNLYLYNNRIETLSNQMFHGTHSLRHLSFDNNLLTSLPAGLFHAQKSLKRLTLSDNRIRELNTRIFQPIASKLKLLKLENNNLTSLSRGVFARFSPQILISLHGNPFHCNCKLKWFKYWLRSRSVRILNRALIRCSSPPRLAGKMISMVPDTAFICPVHGQWSAWTRWEPCSKTCSNGVKIRRRQCDNPTPALGGQTCRGSHYESKYCFVKRCPVSQIWGSWSQWSPCSTSCATGIQRRHRVCRSHSYLHGGKNCHGKRNETRQCLNPQCPPKNWWSEWSPWSRCSKSCDVGEEKRTRRCQGKAPKICTGVATETKKCKINTCSINGQWSHWQTWSACTVSCGIGEQARQRSCNNPSPEFGGKKCEGQEREIRACRLIECPVNGGWSEWSNWTACSVKCGYGLKVRTRKCDNPLPKNKGLNCSGDSVMVKKCKISCDLKPVWSQWVPWSSCSATCNKGHQIRWRICHTKTFHKLSNCSATGPFQAQIKICEIQNCNYQPTWTMWTPWSECSRTCQGGTRTRQRFCQSKIVGVNCVGDNMKSEVCGVKKCPVKLNTKHSSVIKLGSPIPCPDLKLFKNGRIKLINQYGSHFAIYSCKKYFTLKGPRYRHCEMNHQWSDSEPSCSPICGQTEFPTHDRLRIFGGQEVKQRGEWPWQVALENNRGLAHCGGTLINEQWVVTAAHCVLKSQNSREPYKRVKVYLGVLNITQRHRDKHVQFRPSKKIIFHQQFNWTTYDSDLALIKLKWKINITKSVRPVCLPNRAQRHQLKPGVKGIMLGWGEIETGEPVNALRKVIMPVVGRGQCQTVYKDWWVTSNMVCAGYNSGIRDSCTRDSGGGFLFYDRRRHKRRWFLGGVISWGNPVCGRPGKYSVNTKMTHGYVKWIKRQIQDDQRHDSMLADGPKQDH